MNIDDLIREIDTEIIKLKEEISTPNEIAEFLGNFFNETKFQKIDDIINIELPNIFIAILLSKCENIDFNELKRVVYSNEDLFDSTQTKRQFLKKCSNILSVVFPDCLRSRITKFFNNYSKEQYDFCSLVAKYPEEVSVALGIVGNIINLRQEIGKVTPFANKFDTSKFDKAIKEVEESSHSIILQNKNIRKKAHKELNCYEKTKQWLLEKQDSTNPIDVNQDLYKLPKLEIKLAILKKIYVHNLSICEKAESEYTYLISNSKNRYKRVLSEHGILLGDEQINFSISVDDLDETLTLLERIDFTSSEDIIKILTLTNKIRVENIVSLINIGFIKKSLVHSMIDLFDVEKEIYGILSKNISVLNEKNVSVTTINDMNDVLLSKSLLTSINIIEGYFPSCQVLKKSSSYDFMKDDKEMAQKINIMIELGYYDNLVQDMSLLGYPSDSYKKLIILKRMHLLPESTSDIIAVLESNLFNGNESVNDFLFDMRKYPVLEDTTITKQQFLEKLDNTNSVKNDLNCYHFGNVLISKVKVKNELERYQDDTLTSLDQFTILTKDKVIDSCEYSTIKNLIESSTVDKKVFQKS